MIFFIIYKDFTWSWEYIYYSSNPIMPKLCTILFVWWFDLIYTSCERCSLTKKQMGLFNFTHQRPRGISHLSFLKPLLDAQVCCNCSLVENPVFLDIRNLCQCFVFLWSVAFRLSSLSCVIYSLHFISFYFSKSYTAASDISFLSVGILSYSLCTCKVISFNLLHKGFQFLRWLLLLLSKLLDFFCESKLLSRSGASCVLVIFGLFVV